LTRALVTLAALLIVRLGPGPSFLVFICIQRQFRDHAVALAHLLHAAEQVCWPPARACHVVCIVVRVFELALRRVRRAGRWTACDGACVLAIASSVQVSPVCYEGAEVWPRGAISSSSGGAQQVTGSSLEEAQGLHGGRERTCA
jgi:hypothetical protein